MPTPPNSELRRAGLDPLLQPAQPAKSLMLRKKTSPGLQDFGTTGLNLLKAKETDRRARFALRPCITILRGRTMASQAQIDANRRNAQRSTGPKAGKARAKLNALKDGSHAKTVRPVLPQEDPIELDQRINKWINDLNPRNDAERELVIDAAELAWTIDRTKRSETARLAERVRQAMLKAEAQRYEEVGELGRRLLYNTEAKPLPTPGTALGRQPGRISQGAGKQRRGMPLAAGSLDRRCACCWTAIRPGPTATCFA